MYILAAYFIKPVIAGGVLYAYYLLALRNKKFHTFNRFYLLASVVLTLVIPFINIHIFQVESAGQTTLASFSHTVSNAGTATPQVLHVTTTWVITGVLLLVSLLLLAAMLGKIAWIYRVKKAGKITREHGFTLIETNVRQAPFSFLNNLFWRAGMPFDDANGQKVFFHELAHIKQRHTYDKLFMQTTLCLFWMNPFYWLIQKELNTVHEFIADAAAIEEGDSASFAAMLLQAHNGGRYLSPASSFYHSSIKRRLLMVSTQGKTSNTNARRVIALVLAILVLGVFSVSLQARQTSQVVDHIEIHGQTGIGDTAIVYFKNGTNEKYLLNNPAENKIFKKKYEALLQFHPNPPGPKKNEQPTQAGIEYLPLDPVPASISRITFGSSTVWLTLTSGVQEQYNLNNADEKKSFESRYGKLTVAHKP